MSGYGYRYDGRWYNRVRGGAASYECHDGAAWVMPILGLWYGIGATTGLVSG